MREAVVVTFDEWREAARRLLRAEIPPPDIAWRGHDEPKLLLPPAEDLHPDRAAPAATVPAQFLTLAKCVADHRGPERWPLLYQALWRLTHGEPHLFELASDDLVVRLTRMEKAIRRDIHKMHAFVRFRRCNVDGIEQYIAWYRADHHILRADALGDPYAGAIGDLGSRRTSVRARHAAQRGAGGR